MFKQVIPVSLLLGSIAFSSSTFALNAGIPLEDFSSYKFNKLLKVSPTLNSDGLQLKSVIRVSKLDAAGNVVTKYIPRTATISRAVVVRSFGSALSATGGLAGAFIQNPWGKATIALAAAVGYYYSTQSGDFDASVDYYYPVKKTQVTAETLTAYLDSIPQCDRKDYTYSYLVHTNDSSAQGYSCNWQQFTREGDIPDSVCALGTYGIRTMPGLSVVGSDGTPVEILSTMLVKFPVAGTVTPDEKCADVVPSFQGEVPTESEPANRYRTSDITAANAYISEPSVLTEEQRETLIQGMTEKVFTDLEPELLTEYFLRDDNDTLLEDVSVESLLTETPITEAEWAAADTAPESITENDYGEDYFEDINADKVNLGNSSIDNLTNNIGTAIDKQTDELSQYEQVETQNCFDDCIERLQATPLVSNVLNLQDSFVGSEQCPIIPYSIIIPFTERYAEGEITIHCDLISSEGIETVLKAIFSILFIIGAFVIVLGA